MKIGDKVRITESCWHAPSHGQTGEIVREIEKSFKIKLDIPNNFTYLFVKKTDVEIINKHMCKGLILCKKCIKNIRKIL